MLSYFLGGDPQQAMGLPDFATSGGPKEVDSSAEDSDDQACPPPTPVMHFYANPSKPLSSGAPFSARTSSSSSLSSMNSMTASLLNGVPSMPGNQMHSGSDITSPKLSKDSPISPAQAIGGGSENLMLPPPPRPPGAVTSPSATVPPAPPGDAPTAEQQAQHLAWFSDIHAMARANGTIPAAPPIQQPPAGFIPSWATIQQSQHQVPRRPEKESDEKRALRLQRNRESARKSRRLKKERLTTLEKKVNGLYAKVSQLRLAKIMGLVDGLRLERLERLTTLNVDANGLLFILRSSGPRSEIFKSIAEFQYATIKQLLLPRYQSMMHWFALQTEDYFTLGKAEFIRNQASSGKARVPAARLSSKQVGEELTKNGKDVGPMLPNVNEYDVRPTRTSYIRDAARMWPLFCFELSFSVEQEEKFLAAQKRLRRRPDVLQSREESAAACKATANLRHAMESLSTLVSKREESATAGILSPDQAKKLQIWLDGNRGRCREKASSVGCPAASLPEGKEVSMEYISERLSQVLQIRDGRE